MEAAGEGDGEAVEKAPVDCIVIIDGGNFGPTFDVEVRSEVGGAAVGGEEEEAGGEAGADLPLIKGKFLLFGQIDGEVKAVEEFKEGLARLGDRKVGEIGAEVGLAPLNEDHFGAGAPGKLIVRLEVEGELRPGGLFLSLEPLFGATGSAKELEPLEKDEGKAGELGVEVELAEGVVGIEVGVVLICFVPLVLCIVVNVARSEFEEGIGRGEKAGIHDCRIGRITDVRAEKRKC